MVWSMVSKAADKSSRQRQVTCCSPTAWIRWSCIDRRTVSVEWNLRYADWSGLNRVFWVRWSVKRHLTTRWIILDIVERLEMGLYSWKHSPYWVTVSSTEDVMMDCLSLGQNWPVERLRLAMRVITGARIWQRCLSSEVGMASRPHCLLGQSLISLIISSSVAGRKTLPVEMDSGQTEHGWQRELDEAVGFSLWRMWQTDWQEKKGMPMKVIQWMSCDATCG